MSTIYKRPALKCACRIWMKAYFTSLPLRCTRSLFPGCRDPSSCAPAGRTLAADLRLLGAHSVAVSADDFAGQVRLDPVEQRLVYHGQRAGRRSDALASFDQPHGLWLELERVARSSVSSSSFRSPCVD